MKTLLGKIAFVGFVALLVTSCSPPMYIPDTVHVTTLTEKNEAEIYATGGTNGFDLGVGYAITRNFGIQAKGSLLASGVSDADDFMRRSYADLGIGYTNVFGPDGSSSEFVYSVFGGAGYGSAEGSNSYTISTNSSSNTNVNYSKGDYTKYWLQPMIGYKNPYIECLLSTRASFVQFVTLNNVFDSNPQGLDLNGASANIFIEPAFTFRGGSEKIKGMVQVGYSFRQLPLNTVRFRNREIMLSMGLMLNLGK